MNVIDGGFGAPQDTEDRVANEIVAALEAAIDEVVADPVDLVVIVTMAGNDINNIRVEGLGGACPLLTMGVLQKAVVAVAASS